MNKPLKLVAVGNSTGVVLPRELLARMKVEKGDALFAVETPDGLELRVHNPDFETEMEAMRAVMHRRRAALSELAK